MEVLASRLKWLREKHRYGQKEVASEIEVTTSGYQKMEYGEAKPKIEVLIKLAQFYNVSTDFLLGLSDDIDNEKINFTIESAFELRNMLKVLRHKKIEMEHRMYTLQEKERYLHYKINNNENEDIKNEITVLEREIDHIRFIKNEVEHDIYKRQTEFRDTIIEYIETLLDIPFAKPSRNKFIKSIQPFNIEIQPTLFDSFTLLISDSEGFLGEYKEYENYEEAKSESEKILELFNG